jgi:hypothetical protein
MRKTGVVTRSAPRRLQGKKDVAAATAALPQYFSQIDRAAKTDHQAEHGRPY